MQWERELQGQTGWHRADLLLGGEVVKGQIAVKFSVCDTVGSKAHKYERFLET